MEGLILHYYLKVFSTIFFISSVLIISYTFFILNKKIELVNNSLTIEKGENIKSIFKKNSKNLSNIDIQIISYFYKINNIVSNNYIHFGDFYFEEKKINIFELFKIITNPSNVYLKITIIEGWSQKQLNNELSKYFTNTFDIAYEDIIADTYYFKKHSNFNTFVKNLYKVKENYFKNNYSNDINNFYNNNEIITIGSLLEKEGLDYNDKLNISSVIFNRLHKKMKLQIDATVIFAITDGQYNLERNLKISDLKIKHPYNTYFNKGLPPKPISYVGKKTLDIIFKNYKSDFLFYFFDKSLNKHIFSKNYEEHKTKLNEYRKKQ